MPKFRDRVCVECGVVEKQTATKSDVCLSCYWSHRSSAKIEKERAKISAMYGSVEGPSYDKHVKRCYTFTHVCGTEQTWRFDNFLKQLKSRPDSVPCTKCGGKERMSKALAGYVEKYGRDFDVEKWLDYRKLVRRLTEATYKKFKSEINPLDLKRGMRDWHLDHKMPIIRGFIEGLPPEALADRSNLQMLPAFDNISKGRKSWQEKENIPLLET